MNNPPPAPGSALEVLQVALRLGLTSFGGPIAHLGYFRDEYVVRRKWLDEPTYADLVALCQFLPGPASSQVGIAIGVLRAGILGGVCAWAGFTLPSALLLITFAYGLGAMGDALNSGWLHGLKIVAVAVVAQALWGMAKSLCPDRQRATLAFLAAVVMLIWPTSFGQIVTIIAGGLIGWRCLTLPPATVRPSAPLLVTRRMAIISWGLLILLVVGLPVARGMTDSQWLAITDSFFRVGSLVFGGGHVVLPLLEREVVGPGWLNNEQFVAGYGVTQAVPGPLFTFSAYIGAMIGGWNGAWIALAAMFLPSFFLVIGALPFWHIIRANESYQAALCGINAAVVGLLLAALYNPVWLSAIHTPPDLALAFIAFALLAFWRWPPWSVVLLTAFGGTILAFMQ